MSRGWTGGTQKTFKFHARNHIGIALVMVEVFIGGRIEDIGTTTENGRAYLDLSFSRFLIMDDSFGCADLHTLEAFTAVSAVQATVGLFFSPVFIIAQFDFLEVAFPILHRKLRHFCPVFLGFIFRYRAVRRIFQCNGLPSFGHVPAVQVSDNRLGSLATSSNGSNGYPGACLQIATGKNTLVFSRISYWIYLGGPPA